MTQEQAKKFSRKGFMKFMRKTKGVAAFAAISAFFFGLLTTRDMINIPYIHFEHYLPEHLPPLSDTLWQQNIKGFLLSNVSAFLTFFIPAYIVGFIFYSKFVNDDDDREIFKRGAQMVNPKELKKIIEKEMKERKDKPYIWFGKQQIPIPFQEVPRNFLFLGKVGAGKTQAIFNEIFGIYDEKGKKLKPGIVDYKQTMIIYDRKPDFTPLLYREGKDFLFDPRDKRGVRWNIFDDILTEDKQIDESMLDFICKVVAPVDPDSKSAHFDEQAQGIIKAIFVKIGSMKNPTNKLLIDFIQANGEGVQLRNALINDKNVIKYGLKSAVLNALTLGQGGLDNQGNSVMATLNKAFKGISRREFYYSKGNFSIRWFIKTIDEQPDRRLFIVNTKKMAGAYTTYFSIFLGVFFKIGVDIPQSSDRRIFVFFDEIQSLGSDGNHALGKNLIEELGNFLAESRSRGYSCAVATQSLPQLEKLIKKEGKNELIQHLSTKILLQYDEADGTEWLSKLIGDKEVERLKESYTQGSNIVDMSKDRIQESDEEKLKKVVLPSEFRTLKRLEGFILTGGHPITKIQIQPIDTKPIAEELIERELPFFDQDSIEKMRNYYKRQAKEEQIKEALKQQKEAQEMKLKMKELV